MSNMCHWIVTLNCVEPKERTLPTGIEAEDGAQRSIVTIGIKERGILQGSNAYVALQALTLSPLTQLGVVVAMQTRAAIPILEAERHTPLSRVKRRQRIALRTTR